MPMVAVVGDPAGHYGGKIASAGQSVLKVNGKPVAVSGGNTDEPHGDLWNWWQSHGPQTLSGTGKLKVNGLPVVLDGDLVQCGATVVASGSPLNVGR